MQGNSTEASKLIDTEVTKAFSDGSDYVPTSVTVAVMVAEASNTQE